MSLSRKIITSAHKHPAVLVLFLTWLAFFSRILSGYYVYFLDDLKIIYYPLEYIYAQAQSAWSLPVWSNYFGFGQPLMSWGQLGYFTPVHFILRALHIPPLDLLQISVAIYFAIGLFGMYAWMRRERLAPWAAALGALVFTFSGFNIGHLNHVNFYTGTMVLPWLLLAVFAFLEKPTINRTVAVSLFGAIIALSAQPQVVTYCFILASLLAITKFCAVLWIQPTAGRGKYLARVIPLTLLAGVLATALSSFAILPVKEFLPLTERNDSLPISELYDFSYPPYHAITLIFPYFFGDHSVYWGPKGFQELAAFTGIVPLLLAGFALGAWRKNSRHALQTASVVLMGVGIILALGQYSPIYQYLVENHIFTGFANPGRFVMFFDFSIALLAALGMHALIEGRLSAPEKKRGVIAALLAIALILSPFLWVALFASSLVSRGMSLTWNNLLTGLICTVGLIVFVASVFPWQKIRRHDRSMLLGIVLVTDITLMAFAWTYNPVANRQTAAASPFITDLQAYAQRTGLPPRLYSRETLLNSGTEFKAESTESIGPKLAIFQPVKVMSPQPCFAIPMNFNGRGAGQLSVGILEKIDSPVLASKSVAINDINNSSERNVCFTTVKSPGNYLLAFTNGSDTGITLEAVPTSIDNFEAAYFVRKNNPTADELRQSHKPLRVTLQTLVPSNADIENILLARHLQAMAQTSSDRWIGALSIRPYREFIEMFFANDREVFDGDNQHVLTRYRNLFDLAGTTHFIQLLNAGERDDMAAANFQLVRSITIGDQEARLYLNPQAFSKVFLVPDAEFIPAADDARAAMSKPTFNPRQLVYISGEVPPATIAARPKTPATGSATIVKYSATRVDVAVVSSDTNWLILNDAMTPQWQVFIDNQPAPAYAADTIFKAAQVPAGQHVVSFRYLSPAVELSKKLTLGGAITALLLLTVSSAWTLFHNRSKSR